MKNLFLLLFIVPLFFACSSDDEDNEEHIKREIVAYLKNKLGYQEVVILDFKKYNVPYKNSEMYKLNPSEPDKYTNKHYYVSYRFALPGTFVKKEARYFNENCESLRTTSIK